MQNLLAFFRECAIINYGNIVMAKEWTKVHSFVLPLRWYIRTALQGIPSFENKMKWGMHMSKREEYEQRTEKLLQPIIEEGQYELVDVEFVKEAGNWYLRVYADKEGGITVDDCEIISRALSDLLDEQDYIEESYILEVSSPGLGRPLKKEKDFIRSRGEEVEVHLYKAVNKQKMFEGILTDFDADTVTIETEDGEAKTFAKADIALIRLAFDW